MALGVPGEEPGHSACGSAAGEGAGHCKHEATIRSLKLSAPGSQSLESAEGLEVCCFFN